MTSLTPLRGTGVCSFTCSPIQMNRNPALLLHYLQMFCEVVYKNSEKNPYPLIRLLSFPTSPIKIPVLFFNIQEYEGAMLSKERLVYCNVQSVVEVLRADTDRMCLLCLYTNACQIVVSTPKLQVIIIPLNLNPYMDY